MKADEGHRMRMVFLGDECIHGFEDGLCAVCFPREAPTAPAEVAAGAPRTVRARAASRPAARRPLPGVTTPRSATLPVKDVSEQRIYHVTHIQNLSGILAGGRVAAEEGEAGGPQPAVDISSPRARESRRATVLPGSGSSIASYVPFFLSPDARVWDSIRSGEADPRLAGEVGGYAASEFVILVSTVKAVFAAQTGDEPGAKPGAEPQLAYFAMTDGDATGALTRFGTGRENSERMLRTLRADGESETLLDAEFLVKPAFPFELITLVGVSGEKARDQVRAMLAQTVYRPKVAVYPPWFRREETSR